MIRYPNGQHIQKIKKRTYYAMTRIKGISDGKVDYDGFFKNDHLGRRVSATATMETASVTTTRTYNNAGSLLSEVTQSKGKNWSSTTESIHDYNDKNLLKKKTTVTSMSGQKNSFETIYEYNELEQLIKLKDKTSESIFKYDSAGNMVESTTRGDSGYWFTVTNVYDSDGRSIESKSNSSMGMTSKTTSEYDAHGNVIKNIMTTGDGKKSVYLFEYEPIVFQ